MTMTDIGPINSHRLQVPDGVNWAKSVQPNADDRYLVVTIDSHANEPLNVFELGGLDPKFRDRVPHVTVDDEGRQLMHVEGWDRPQLVRGRRKAGDLGAELEGSEIHTDGQMWSERMEPDDLARNTAGSTANADEPGLVRLHADMKADGVDGAVVFANRALLGYASHDPEFVAAACHAYNVWARDVYGPFRHRFKAVANLPTCDVDVAIRELEFIAESGFDALNIPNQPMFGYQGKDELLYNHPMFDRLWAAIAETGIPMCMHVATGKDPRASTGSGGALLNKTTGFLGGVMGPLAALLSSGVFERHTELRFVTVEADIGWIPWLLDALDHAFLKHHMWVRPVLKELPSHYYRTNCASSFIEDRAGLLLARPYDIVDNVLWSNDYPHQEGTWPHSPEAMLRELADFTETEREKILSGNACRIFGFDPVRLRAASA